MLHPDIAMERGCLGAIGFVFLEVSESIQCGQLKLFVQ